MAREFDPIEKNRSGDQRISDIKVGKAGEVAVGRPQLSNPVQVKQSGDPGVMDLPAGDASGFNNLPDPWLQPEVSAAKAPLMSCRFPA